MAASWTWSLNPSSPAAGDKVDIDVDVAPGTPVAVEVWLDNVLFWTGTIESVPGSASCTFPGDASGKPYKIKISHGSDSASKTGTLL
jgi:hypothetical protein